MTRKHEHEEVLDASPADIFALLHTPSAIRGWWGASRAIVNPVAGGTWAAAWGEDEDLPDYITTAVMKVFEPPARIIFGDYSYFARSGALPFDVAFITEFSIAPHPDGAILRVIQDGFPAGSEADDFYAACGQGWHDTFRGIRKYLEQRSATQTDFL
jgi:uncharacterized protein YndB with AHSA1/START domain